MVKNGEHDGTKIAVMAVLLGGCYFLTVYWHVVLERGSVFSFGVPSSPRSDREQG